MTTLVPPKARKKGLSPAQQEALCRSTIFAAPAAGYGGNYQEHLFEQYKIFVESVNYTSELKLRVNTYFVTINSALVTAAGLSLAKVIVNPLVWHLLLPLAGIFISLVWWAVTYSYKQRNIVKLRMIHCLEERMPLTLFKTEWQLMDENHATPFKRFFFHIDLFIPWVFIVSYLFFALLS